ncbi:EF-hand calcium-binding domain-containing protein 1 [Melipona quadrifasciata]|uniref:EF-hand calcium-binding domain-containing protein 1 n=1 Tax=Melipona quadrifasciata TaxID=166423 RepID=A0A0M8ZZH1_9HYME|nr:EF-hand calcium-binding domain-containing protein 1 [Melipona quadrifasciata]
MFNLPNCRRCTFDKQIVPKLVQFEVDYRRMSGERSLSSSAKARMDRGNGVGVGVGVGADDRGTASLRAGATLMKSVSIFLMSGRKASVNSNRQIFGSPKHEPRRKHRRRMPVAGTARTSAHTVKLMELLKRKTRFSWQYLRSVMSELDNLCKQYKNLISSGQQQVGQSAIIGRRTQSSQAIEGIDRVIFRELLHNTFKVITEDALVERIFCCWDRENEGIIRLEPWIMGLDLYLRGSLREKIEFCFKVYDLNNDGNCLLKQPGEEDPDEAVKDLSELALKKLDVDRDGKISFQDYKVAVTEEPLLLEAFGQCLSTDENCAAILASLRSHLNIGSSVGTLRLSMLHTTVNVFGKKNSFELRERCNSNQMQRKHCCVKANCLYWAKESCKWTVRKGHWQKITNSMIIQSHGLDMENAEV